MTCSIAYVLHDWGDSGGASGVNQFYIVHVPWTISYEIASRMYCEMGIRTGRSAPAFERP